MLNSFISQTICKKRRA